MLETKKLLRTILEQDMELHVVCWKLRARDGVRNQLCNMEYAIVEKIGKILIVGNRQNRVGATRTERGVSTNCGSF